MMKTKPTELEPVQPPPSITTVNVVEIEERAKNEENVCKIDIRNNVDDENEDDNTNDEKVCRICQLSVDQVDNTSNNNNTENNVNINLVRLGCACKGELGISHYHCAFAWFHQKGNRTCEICGKPAKNIEGIEDEGFRAFGRDISITSSEILAINSSSINSNSNRRRCTKFICNVMLAALVIACLLPWAFHPSKFL